MALTFHPNHPAVLVVEDEPVILMDTADTIREAGFSVYEAHNADEAVRLLKLHSQIRVLFTDIRMPGSMDGLQLAHDVSDRRPPVAVIVTSGHARLTGADLPSGGTFLAKPYAEAVAIKAIRTAMDGLI